MKKLFIIILLCITIFGSEGYDSAIKLLNDNKIKEGIQALTKLAKDGDIDAQLDLYDNYNHGIYTKKDQKKAMYWIKKAAKRDSNAMAALGAQYIKQSNYVDGKVCLDKAAKDSSPVALWLLGAMYFDGTGVKQNCETSYKYHMKAIKAKSSQSAEYLFIAYNEGNTCIKKNK